MAQHTHKGRTAGGWLRAARTAQMQAGTWEIVHDELPDALIVGPTDHGSMVIAYSDPGRAVTLDMSDRARARLETMTADTDARMVIDHGMQS